MPINRRVMLGNWDFLWGTLNTLYNDILWLLFLQRCPEHIGASDVILPTIFQLWFYFFLLRMSESKLNFSMRTAADDADAWWQNGGQRWDAVISDYSWWCRLTKIVNKTKVQTCTSSRGLSYRAFLTFPSAIITGHWMFTGRDGTGWGWKSKQQSGSLVNFRVFNDELPSSSV